MEERVAEKKLLFVRRQFIFLLPVTESLFQLLSKTIFLEAAAVAVVVAGVVVVVVAAVAGVVGCFQSLLKSFSTYCFPSILPGHDISLFLSFSLSLLRTLTHAPTHTYTNTHSFMRHLTR